MCEFKIKYIIPTSGGPGILKYMVQDRARMFDIDSFWIFTEKSSTVTFYSNENHDYGIMMGMHEFAAKDEPQKIEFMPEKFPFYKLMFNIEIQVESEITPTIYFLYKEGNKYEQLESIETTSVVEIGGKKFYVGKGMMAPMDRS